MRFSITVIVTIIVACLVAWCYSGMEPVIPEGKDEADEELKANGGRLERRMKRKLLAVKTVKSGRSAFLPIILYSLVSGVLFYLMPIIRGARSFAVVEAFGFALLIINLVVWWIRALKKAASNGVRIFYGLVPFLALLVFFLWDGLKNAMIFCGTLWQSRALSDLLVEGMIRKKWLLYALVIFFVSSAAYVTLSRQIEGWATRAADSKVEEIAENARIAAEEAAKKREEKKTEEATKQEQQNGAEDKDKPASNA